MKLYIAGPMTGYDYFNYPAFNDAQEKLQQLGYETENPANPEFIDQSNSDKTVSNFTYNEAMRHGLKLLLECDAIVLLNDWEKSKGARREKELAEFLEMPVYMLHQLINE